MRSFVIVSVIGLCACRSEAGPVAVELAAHCQPATALSFVDTQIGQTSVARVLVSSTNGDSLAMVGVSIDGPDADEFSTSSSCGSGPPDDFCTVQVSLAPTSTGSKAAVLHVGDQPVSLSGNAIAASTGLFATIANIDVTVAPLNSNGATFTLENLGSAPIMLDPAGNTNGDNFVLATSYSDCPLPITAGGVCTVNVGFLQLDNGCVDTTAHLTSDVANIDLPITSQMITIAAASVGSTIEGGRGQVTSDVGAIDCTGDGSRCAARVDATSITYTAVPDADSVFNGWFDPRCNQSSTCSYPIDALHMVPNAMADFAPATAHAINVTFAGDGTGVVKLNGKLCASSCTVYVADGTGAGVSAVANSLFAGFAGACVGTTPQCDLGLIVNDRDVTVTFAKDATEVTSTAAPLFGAARYIAGGDLIVLSEAVGGLFGTIVTRISPSGGTVWSRLILGPRMGEAITDTGSVYVLAGAQPRALVRIGSDGAIQWRVDSGLGGPLAVSGEDAVMGVATGVAIVAAADGSTVRTLATAHQPDAIAVAPDGTIAASLQSEVDRFASGGASLPAVTLPAFTDPSAIGARATLAYDATGVLFALRGFVPSIGGGTSGAKLTRIETNGTQTYTVDLDTSAGSAAGNTGGGVLAIAGDGTVVALRMHAPQFYTQFVVGAFVEAYDNLTGARKWQVDKQGARTGPGAAVTGFVGGTLLVTSTGGVQLLGIRNDTDGQAVLETFSL